MLLLNTMVLFRLLYCTECLPLSEAKTRCFVKIMEHFVFGVLVLPLVVATKTLHTHRSHGMRLGHFPILHSARVLDTLQRNPHIHSFCTTSCAVLCCVVALCRRLHSQCISCPHPTDQGTDLMMVVSLGPPPRLATQPCSPVGTSLCAGFQVSQTLTKLSL